MQPLPHARLVPFLQTSPTSHARAAAHLLGEHLPGYAALQDEQDAGEGSRSSMRGLPPLGFGGSQLWPG
jgi:hypothetical protein